MKIAGQTTGARSLIRRAVLGLLVGSGVAGAFAGTAAAAGSCGNDFSGNTACPIPSSPMTMQGTLAADNENDYYVFFADAGTELRASITDQEDPGCSTGALSYDCGAVSVELLDASGNSIDNTGASSPDNGIAVPETLDHVIDSTGTFYLVVQGDLNGVPLPYSLSVDAPGIHWPPRAVQVCHVNRQRVRRRVWVRTRHGLRRQYRWVWVSTRTCSTRYV